MAPTSEPFELCIEGTDQLRQYVCYVPDGHGGRAAEHMFEWRHDTVDLALRLNALARAAETPAPPEKPIHVEFGQELINLLSEEEPHDGSSA